MIGGKEGQKGEGDGRESYREWGELGGREKGCREKKWHLIRKKKQNLKPSSILETGRWALFMDGIDHKDVTIIDE